MKKILTFVFAILCLLLVPKTAQAYDFTADGVFYNINADVPTTVSVTFDGDEPGSVAGEYSGDVIIPATVSNGDDTYTITSIGARAMFECSGVTSVTLPATLTSLGECAFQFCTSLNAIVIPDGVTTIYDAAFYGCSALQTVTIGTGISSLTSTNGVFNGCSALTLIICNTTAPPTIDDPCFTNATPLANIHLRVPCSLVDAYKANARWGQMDVQGLVEIVSATTVDATDVSDYFATLHKNVEFTANCGGTQGFEYRITGVPEWSISTDGILTDLTPATDYEFRAYAQGTIGEPVYGETKYFSTLAAISRTVTFNAGTGTCSTTSLTGTSIELPTAAACDENWTFAGWSEARVSATADAPVLVVSPYAPKKEITLYAVYSKTETAPVPAYVLDAEARQFVVAAKVGDAYYAAPVSLTGNYITGAEVTTTADEETGQVYTTSIDAAGKVWTIVRTGDNITIADGNNYLKRSGGNNSENLAKTAGSYNWAISEGSYGAYRIVGSTGTNRALAYRTSANRFAGYATANINGTDYYDIELIPVQEINTTYASFPICGTTVTRTVSFESNGGSAVASQTLANNDVAVKPDDPAKENFVFENWYSDEVLTTVYDFNTPVTADITLYAKWTVTKFSVTGEDSKTIWYRVTSDDPLEVEVSFSGAAWDAVGGEYTGVIVIPETVTYEGLTYAVTAVGDNAFREIAGSGQITSVTLPNTIAYIGAYAFANQIFTSITIPAAVTEIGDYALDGLVLTEVICWATTPPYIYAAFGDDYSDATLYVPCASSADYLSDATYWSWYFSYIEGIPEVATVDATEITTASATLNKTDAPADCAEVTAEGYLWRSTANAAQTQSTEPYFVAGEEEVNAEGWNISTDGLLTDLTDGTEYQFRAYATATAGTAYGALKTFTTVSIYTVTFESNGGSEVAPQTVVHNDKATEPEDPTKEGNTFAGWYSDSELTTLYDFDTPVTADITLYAKWTVNTYTVTFVSNGGSGVAPQTVVHNDKATEPEDPTKEGNTFAGWYSDSELTTAYDFDTPVTADITLYAKWTPFNSISNPNRDNNFSAFVQNRSLVANINVAEAGTADINIYNSQGALLVTKNIALMAGNNQKTLNDNLIQGIYIVRIVYKNTVTTVKVVK
ncbi:MAG: InlB B-repeat-containing protein [Dysgonamonadaceae bacterium]|jgi:uncharacterized repeat protein (TIGR02543 family)|nr:InlB B-repeat-containing protein [Dysgonamonadaceae bacterium]